MPRRRLASLHRPTGQPSELCGAGKSWTLGHRLPNLWTLGSFLQARYRQTRARRPRTLWTASLPRARGPRHARAPSVGRHGVSS
jgi:hypothetical protein